MIKVTEDDLWENFSTDKYFLSKEPGERAIILLNYIVARALMPDGVLRMVRLLLRVSTEDIETKKATRETANFTVC